MTVFDRRFAAFALFGAVVAAPGAHAAGVTARDSYIPAGAVADAPNGFVEMCKRDSALCLAGHQPAVSAATPSPAADCVAEQHPGGGCAISPTAALKASAEPVQADAGPKAVATRGRRAGTSEAALIRRVNLMVNAQVRQVPDLVSAGVDERWERPVSGMFGDCEDIAIEKRMRLIQAGYDPAKLFFAVVFKRDFGLHTVLIARTGRGDVVLDSLISRVKPWARTRYAWLRVQSAEEPTVWKLMGRPGQNALASQAVDETALAVPPLAT